MTPTTLLIAAIVAALVLTGLSITGFTALAMTLGLLVGLGICYAERQGHRG